MDFNVVSYLTKMEKILVGSIEQRLFQFETLEATKYSCTSFDMKY